MKNFKEFSALEEVKEVEEVVTPHYGRESFIKKTSLASMADRLKKQKQQQQQIKPVKESDASWAASMEKQKENRLTAGDKKKLDQTRALLAKEKKPVKEEYDLLLAEDFEILEEAANAIDKGEYDYEGQMARTQLQTTLRNCKDMIEMIKDDDNMPEWVQSKITLAQDYITTVRDYLQSKEELGEAHKLGDKVIMTKGPSYVVGKTGHIGEIRKHYIGAPKTYTIDHDDGSIQLKSTHFKAVKAVKEEVEDLDESGFHDTLASRGAADKDHHPQWGAATKDWQKAHPKYNKERTKDIKSQIKGRIGRGDYAKKSNLPEEVEDLDELSSDLLKQYKKNASDAATAADKAGKYDIGHKRFKGILKATFKQFANDAKKNG